MVIFHSYVSLPEGMINHQILGDRIFRQPRRGREVPSGMTRYDRNIPRCWTAGFLILCAWAIGQWWPKASKINHTVLTFANTCSEEQVSGVLWPFLSLTLLSLQVICSFSGGFEYRSNQGLKKSSLRPNFGWPVGGGFSVFLPRYLYICILYTYVNMYNYVYRYINLQWFQYIMILYYMMDVYMYILITHNTFYLSCTFTLIRTLVSQIFVFLGEHGNHKWAFAQQKECWGFTQNFFVELEATRVTKLLLKFWWSSLVASNGCVWTYRPQEFMN